jgi:glycosyltransferase involved in cell wall biosynthesis
MTTFYSLLLAKFMKIKILNGSIRNAFSKGGYKWKLEKLLLNKSDYIVANSKAGLQSRNFTCDSKKYFIIYNGFDLKRIKGGEACSCGYIRRKLEGKNVVGMVAEFSDLKDYNTFFMAAKDILKDRTDIVFLAIGDGKYYDYYKNDVCRGIENILFAGRVKNVEDYIRHFHVGVLATYTEGISNAIIEYMANMKPVIATDGGGSKEIIIDGVTGYLIPKTNYEELVSKILYLIDNPNRATLMGEAGRKRIETGFTLDIMVNEYIKLFSQIVKI